MTFSPDIVQLVGFLFITAMGIAGMQFIKNLVTAQQKKTQEFFDDVKKMKDTQNRCQVNLEHMNLPKYKEMVEELKMSIRPIHEIESIIKRVDNNVSNQNIVVAKFTEKVEGMGKLLDQYRSMQEEHFTMVENAFAAKVAGVMQEHLSAFRVEQGNNFEMIARRLEKTERDVKELYERMKIVEAMKCETPNCNGNESKQK